MVVTQSRKRGKLMNGKGNNHNENNNKGKRSNLVLDEFLGRNVANKLDTHLYIRPDPSELVSKGIMSRYI